jgi:tRNA threonylcarbamoyladenosine biosynthesis protein TsaE
VRESVSDLAKTWRSPTAEATEAFGAKLAASRPPRADSLTVVCLTGDLGAGKTTLARGFLQALGVAGVIRSPTYTLLETYETPAATVVHLDLYRLRDTAELEPLGLRDLALPGHVWLIEWPERGEGGLPAADVHIVLTVGDGAHHLAFRGLSDYGRAWLAQMSA